MMRLPLAKGLWLTVVTGVVIAGLALAGVVASLGCGGGSGGSITWVAQGTWWLEAMDLGAGWFTHAEAAADFTEEELVHYAKLWIGPQRTARGETGVRTQAPEEAEVVNGTWSGTGPTRTLSIADRNWTAELVSARLVLTDEETATFRLRFIRATLYWPWSVGWGGYEPPG